jgi:Response regulator containing CheY-like receiver, AAA-type ATPase, and DNA-binding domains
MTLGSDTQALYERLLQRETEQQAQIVVCQKLAPINSHTAFDAIQNDLKNFLGQDILLLFTAAPQEITYNLFFQSKKNTPLTSQREHSCKEVFFQDCINSAEPIQHDADQILRLERSFPTELAACIRAGSKATVSIAFRLHNQYWVILCLTYKKLGNIDSRLQQRIKALLPQLSISIGNILINEQSTYPVAGKSHANSFISPSSPTLPTSTQVTPPLQIIGQSSSIKMLKSQLTVVANSTISVLIQGESGTGKEIVAQNIHHLSARSQGPLIKVNCAAIAPSLIESELFGHEKGSFSGAIKRKIGKFEQADGGTLFLDEIGDLPFILQAKLLRVLQEKEIERVGGNKAIPIDVRIICATHKELENEVCIGNFRSDLYFRINAFPLTLPALRERQDDIPLLVLHFLEKHAGQYPPKQMGKKMLERLRLCSWPGNIRELEHVVARSILLSDGPTIKRITLPKEPDFVTTSKAPDFTLQTLAEFEKKYIIWVLRSCNGRISGPTGAATILGIPATTLQSKMKKLGINKKFADSKT